MANIVSDVVPAEWQPSPEVVAKIRKMLGLDKKNSVSEREDGLESKEKTSIPELESLVRKVEAEVAEQDTIVGNLKREMGSYEEELRYWETLLAEQEKLDMEEFLQDFGAQADKDERSEEKKEDFWILCIMKYRFVNSSFRDNEINGYSVPHPFVRPGATGFRFPRSVLLITGVLVFGVFITALNVYELRTLQREHWDRSHTASAESVGGGSDDKKKPIVWVKAKNLDNGFLDHVLEIFDRLGYEHKFGGKVQDWDVLWDHEYPFIDEELQLVFNNLKPHQKVNHVPGSGYYTSKVSLATSNVTGIPPAFSLPNQRDELIEFARRYPDKYWVQKDNNHRGIRVKKIDDLNLRQEESFVQEYVANPLLVDKRKFDIGIYTVIASVRPLRVYSFEGEALLRFCSEDYYPFDPNNTNKYVVHDDYTPVWEMPSLQKYYQFYNYNRKESLNAYLRKSKSGDPKKIWDSIHRTIRGVLLSKLPYFTELMGDQKHPRNFFELSRFDFMVDEDYNVYLMEANMSPNLSSAHFPGNRLLYEQVIYNLLALVGIGRMIHSGSLANESDEERQMQVSEKDLQVYPEYCAGRCASCADWKCRLCAQCIDSQWKQTLASAYLEHQNRQNMRRVIPEPLDRDLMMDEAKFIRHLESSSLSEDNRLLAWWFRGKCLQDVSWCS